MPKKPFSAQHWMDSAATAIMILPGISASTNALRGVKIKNIGKISGVRANKGYLGVRYQNSAGKFKSIEIHPNHHNHGIHLQKNNWYYQKPGYIGKPFRGKADWRIPLFRPSQWKK